MRRITSFTDIQFIINYKLDVKDEMGHNIPFVRFLGIELIDIVKLINAGDWTYDPVL